MESQNQLIKQDCQIVKSAEENAQLFAGLLGRLSVDLKAAIPMAKQLFYDFAHLKKVETIMGCRTQDEWAQRYAKRTARALRYMFDGGNPGTHHAPKAIGSGQKQDGNPFRLANSVVSQVKQDGNSVSVLPTPAFEPVQEIKAKPALSTGTKPAEVATKSEPPATPTAGLTIDLTASKPVDDTYWRRLAEQRGREIESLKSNSRSSTDSTEDTLLRILVAINPEKFIQGEDVKIACQRHGWAVDQFIQECRRYR